MTIKEFLEKFKNDIASVEDLIDVKRYIPSDAKVQIAQEVIDRSAEYDRGFVKFDSYKKHLSFLFGVIEAHTDLCFAENWDDRVKEYDTIYENELLDKIIDTFRKDCEESLMVLNMMCDDMLTDNSIEASVAKLSQSIVENLDVLVGALSDKIVDLDIKKIIPNDLDLNKLQGLLSKIK